MKTLASICTHAAVELWRTRAPNDQMSAAVFHGNSMRISGLVHIGAPTTVPDVAHSESMG
jgi:hypothetical protein